MGGSPERVSPSPRPGPPRPPVPPLPVQRDPVVYPGCAWLRPPSETSPKTLGCAGPRLGKDGERGPSPRAPTPCLNLSPPTRADARDERGRAGPAFPSAFSSSGCKGSLNTLPSALPPHPAPLPQFASRLPPKKLGEGCWGEGEGCVLDSQPVN